MRNKMVVAVVAVLIVGLLHNFGFADEKLSLKGEVRVRGWSYDNVDYTPDYISGYASEDKQKYEFFDQRFRVQSTISPSDGVKGVLRIDFAETAWGQKDRLNMGIRPGYGNGKDFQLDRAYLDVTKGIFNIKAGLQYFMLGKGYTYAKQTAGLLATIKTPVDIELGYLKLSEGVSDSLSDDDDLEDVNQYFVQLSYNSDNFIVKLFYANQQDGQDDVAGHPDEPQLYGVQGIFSIGPVKLDAEIDMFGGTNADDLDYMGTNFLLDASMPLNDALTLGAYLIYSNGNDDEDKIKLSRMPNAEYGDLMLADYGLMNAEIFPLGVGDVCEPLAGYGGDATGSSGSIGGGPYVAYKPIKGLTIWGEALFLSAEKDDLEGKFKSGTVINLSAEYELVKNAFLGLHYMYASVDKYDEDTDSGSVIGSMLRIRF